MKKKILAAMFATVCLAGCAFGLAACNSGSGGNGGGEKTLESLVISDNNDVDKDHYYDLGKFYYNAGVGLDTQFKLYAKYSDGTKQEVSKNDSELTVSYSYGADAIDSLPSVYDLGRYSVTYACNGYEGAVYSATVSFEIVPSATASPYQINLTSSMSFKYLEEPTLSVTKGGDTVSEDNYEVYFITEADYNQTKTASAEDFADRLNEKGQYYYKDGLTPGSYYLYARVGGWCNSTFQKVTVQKAEVVPSVTTGFGSYYMYGEVVGKKIKLSEVRIDRPDELVLTASTDSNKEIVGGEFKWVNGDEQVDCTNSGQTRNIKFVPDGDYAECFNERIFYSVPLTIDNGYMYVPFLDSAEWNYWDGEDHEIKLGLSSSYTLDYFNERITVMHALSEVEVGDDLVLGTKQDIGKYRYTFELKDKVNYCWWDSTDIDNKSDIAIKYFDYEIIPRTSYTYLYNREGDYTIDENLQVKIQIKPGAQSNDCNISPYEAETLQIEILETYVMDEHNTYTTTVDADLEIVNEDGYDWIVITVKEFEDWYGSLQLKVTATGAEHYNDIDVIVKDLYIYKYEPENVTCPISSGQTVEAPTGTTVSELYANEEYAGLETKLGKWELYMYVGAFESDYLLDISDSSWTKLEDTDQLPAGELRCKLTYVSDFVDDVYEIDEVALTLKGV